MGFPAFDDAGITEARMSRPGEKEGFMSEGDISTGVSSGG